MYRKRKLQPHCVIWNDGANRRGDLRWRAVYEDIEIITE